MHYKSSNHGWRCGREAEGAALLKRSVSSDLAVSATFNTVGRSFDSLDKEKKMIIRAEVHSDDMATAVKFDATPWFEVASDMEIFKLAECGVSNPSKWGGEARANEVALYMESKHDGVSFLFDYLRRARRAKKNSNPGYECYVSGGDAVAWIKVHRPRLLSALVTVLELGDVSDLPAEGEPQLWDISRAWIGGYSTEKSLQPSL